MRIVKIRNSSLNEGRAVDYMGWLKYETFYIDIKFLGAYILKHDNSIISDLIESIKRHRSPSKVKVSNAILLQMPEGGGTFIYKSGSEGGGTYSSGFKILAMGKGGFDIEKSVMISPSTVDFDETKFDRIDTIDLHGFILDNLDRKSKVSAVKNNLSTTIRYFIRKYKNVENLKRVNLYEFGDIHDAKGLTQRERDKLKMSIIKSYDRMAKRGDWEQRVQNNIEIVEYVFNIIENK